MAGRPSIQPFKDSDGNWWFGNAFAANLLGITTQSLHNLKGGTWSPPHHSSPSSSGNQFSAKAFGAWMMDVYAKRVDRKKSRVQMPGFEELDGALDAADLSTRVNTATARLKEAQAQKAEIDAMEAMGSVVSAADVEKMWADTFSLVKTRMMKVPYAAATLIAPDMTQAEVQEIITDEVRRALTDAVEGRDVDADIVDEDE